MIGNPKASLPSSISQDASRIISDIRFLSKEPRPAGSARELEMADYVRKRFEENDNLEVISQDVYFSGYFPEEYHLRIANKLIECRPCLCSRSTTKRGVSAELVRYDDDCDPSGKIVLVPVQKVHESLELEEAAELGAIGGIIYQEKGPLLAARVKYPKSSIPAVAISGAVGTKLWQIVTRRVIRAEILIRASQQRSRGINLYARPKTVKPDLMFVAHRDSRIFSPGAIDNASGTSLLLFLSKNAAKSRLSILSTDAEEYGLLGSKRFVESKFDTNSVKVINLDSIGSGSLHLVQKSRGGPLSSSLNRRIRIAASRRLGIKLGHMTTPRGSDSDVFKAAGYEASWLRSFPTPTATTIRDTWRGVSRDAIDEASQLLTALTSS